MGCLALSIFRDFMVDTSHGMAPFLSIRLKKFNEDNRMPYVLFCCAFAAPLSLYRFCVSGATKQGGEMVTNKYVVLRPARNERVVALLSSPYPEEGLEFSTLWCRKVNGSIKAVTCQLRDFPQLLLDWRDFNWWGTLAGAEQEASHRGEPNRAWTRVGAKEQYATTAMLVAVLLCCLPVQIHC